MTTPDTEWEITRYSLVVNGEREMLADPEGEYVKYSDLTSRDTYWKERVRNVAEKMKYVEESEDNFVSNYDGDKHRTSGFTARWHNKILDTLLDNLK